MAPRASSPLRQRTARRRSAGGFMLLEVLIGVLIFSFGVLGLVGLQAAMSRAATVSKVRADASYLATELVGVMWGDLNNIGNYATANCAANTRCKDWSDKVARVLPSGAAAINVTPGNGDVEITITWSTPDASTQTYLLQTNLNKTGV